MLNTLSKTTIKLLIFSTLLFSCEKNETPVNVEIINDEPSEITFSPPIGNWYIYDIPDTFVVNIEGGVPPYIISRRPELSDAFIKDQQLIIYPEKDFFMVFDREESISIQDNDGNISTFPIDPVDSIIRYTSIEAFSFTVYGDTNITRNNLMMDFAAWNPPFNSLGFRVIQDSLMLEFNLTGVNEPGEYTIKAEDLTIRRGFSIPFGYINDFSPINDSQEVEIAEVSDTVLRGSFVIDAASTATSQNPNEYVVKINCNFNFSK